MSISAICSKHVITLDVNASIQEAAGLMKKNHIGDVLVMLNGKVVGILTDRDIAVRLAANDVDFKQVKVSDIMTENVVTLKKSNSITEAIEALSTHGIRRVPIIDEYEKPCGIMSTDDLLILLATQLQKLSQVIEKQIQH